MAWYATAVRGTWKGAAAAWAWVGTYKDQITVLFTIFAAVYAWNKGYDEYLERKKAEQERVATEQKAQSSRYLERYFSPEFLQARRELTTVMFNREKYEKYG